MNRRHSHRYAQPALTRDRDELPRPACEGNPAPFDALIDRVFGPPSKAELDEARAICGTCPLFTACARENRDESWMQMILGVRPKTVTRPTCGTTAGGHAHAKAREAPCDPCKAAWRERYHERKKKGAAA